MMKKRQRIFDYISDERERQDEKWGGKDHDLNHDKGLWSRLIVRQLGDADRALERGDTDDYGNDQVKELIPVLQRFVDTGYVVSSEGDS